MSGTLIRVVVVVGLAYIGKKLYEANSEKKKGEQTPILDPEEVQKRIDAKREAIKNVLSECFELKEDKEEGKA